MTQSPITRPTRDHLSPERFLQYHYCDDDLDPAHVRRDAEHWERVAGDPTKFPDADLVYIDRFTSAAYEWLGGVA